MALRHCFYLVRKFVNFFYVCDYCFFRFFHFSPYNQKDLADLYFYRPTRSILCLGNYSVGWAFCPLTGYFTLPVDKKQYFIFPARSLPVLLPVLQSVPGTVSRTHSQVQACCRTLQMSDRRHARRKFRCGGLDSRTYRV